jgi:E3 ubiquitin-protein ligase mind-bomb
MVACENCAPIMKKCVECRTPIEEAMSFNVCCGGKVGNKEIKPTNLRSGFRPILKPDFKMRKTLM